MQGWVDGWVDGWMVEMDMNQFILNVFHVEFYFANVILFHAPRYRHYHGSNSFKLRL